MKHKRIIAILFVFCTVFAALPSVFATAGEFEPRNVLVSPVNGATGLAVSFINPSTSTLTDVRLFNITDGQNSEILGSILKSPNDVNRIKVMSLQSGKPYYFKLVFTFSGGNSTEYITYGIPSNLMTDQVPTGWNIGYSYADSPGEWQYIPAMMSLDHETYHSGNTSLKIVSNQPESTVSNLYFFLTQGGLPAGADFEMSMWVKRLNVTTSAVKVDMGWQAPWEGNAWDTWLGSGTSDWAKMTLHFGVTGNNELEFFCDRFAEGMWIDDLEVRQILPGGGVGQNLLINPGFELETTPPNNVTSLTATPGNNNVGLSWTNSNSASFKKTNVYIKDNGKLIKRAEIGKDSNSVIIGALENSKEYEFVLKACDTIGNEADGITVKATPDKFDPRNVLVSPVNGATGLAVSFINPSATTLTDVRLFNITDGQNSEILGTILKNPNNVNRIKVTSLQSGKPYYFKLVFTFSGGNSTEYITYGIPSNLMTDQVPTGWNIGYSYADSPGEWQYIPAGMSLDHETYHSGNTSLKIVSNQPESTVSNLYFFLTQGGLPAGADYEMSMWVKRLNVTTSAVKVDMGWQAPWEGNAWDTWLGSGTSDWAKMTLHFGVTGNNELEFFCDRFAEGMWIDDVEVRQMLSGGGLGQNLLTNPGFELETTPPNNVTSLTATPGNNNVRLSWTNSNSASFKKTNVYTKEDGKLIKRAEIGNDSNSVKIGNLVNGRKYEFMLKACDAIGNEADGITVKATPDKFDPRNVLVSPVNGATGLAVSFINPSATTLTDVRLFNITDGQNSEILSSILKSPNDVNRIKVTSLQSGKPYYFKLVFTFSGGNSTEYTTYGIPSNLMTEQVPLGWNINYTYADSPSDWQYLPAGMSLDHETYHGGNTSLKIVSNQPESTVSNLYFFLTQGGLPAGADFEMSMWVKRLNVTTSAVKVDMGWQAPWESDAWDTWLGPKTSDWAKMTLHFGVTGNNELEFFCDRFAETMWIDDLEVRQMLPGGGLGQNLLTNPGFELGITPPDNITSLTAVSGKNQVGLSWTNSNSASFKKTNVYTKEDGKLIKRAEIGNDSNSVTVGALYNDKEYEFVLKSSDAIGNEADGITVKATPAISLYEAAMESATTELNADLIELNELLTECESQGISTDYERMNYKIIEKFIPYIREDFDHGVYDRIMYTIDKLRKLYTEAKTSALAYLSGEKEPFVVPRYVTSPLQFDGKSVISTVSINGEEKRQPVFLIGYGQFNQAQKDVPIFQDLGANILQTEIGPANVMNEDLEIDPVLLQKWLTVLDQAAESNVSVNILLSPQYFPQWIVDQNPEIGNFHNWNMHVNIDYPIVREVLEKYLRGVIPLLKDHPALNSFCMTNEPVYQTHHSAYYRPYYQEFLRNKYGNINSLNTVYNTAYSGFDQIEMPQQIVENVWYYDWKLFNEKVNKEWHEWMAGIIREIAPNVPIHSKVIPLASFEDDTETRSYMSHGMNYDNFINVSDLLGTDGGNVIMSEEGYLGEYMGYDLISSLKDAPIYNSEHHMIKDDTHVYSDEMAKHIETDVWQGVFHGRSMSTIWVWDRDYGGYAFLFGGSILYRPDCVQSVGKVNFDLNRLSAEATALQKVDPQVGILYSDASRVYSPAYMAHVYSAYQGILENGQKAGFVKESQIEKLPNYKMIMIPDCINIKKSTLDAVKEYADNGGKIIILGEDSLKKDELNRPHDVAVVNAILQKAQIIPTQSQGIKVTSPTKQEIFGIFKYAFQNYGFSDIEVIDMSTGEAVQNTEWLSVGYNGAILINAVNYEWDVPKTVQIRKNGKTLTDITELRSGEKLTGNITLSPKTPILLRCIEKVTVTTTGEFDPRNVLVSPVNGATGLAVSFINPSATTLTDVRLFNITDGQNSEILGSILKNPNDVNRIKVMSLQSGKPYYFKLVFTFSDGNPTEYITYGIPSNLMTEQVPLGWNISYNYTGSPVEWQYIPAGMSLDHETYHGGNTSLKIVSNQPESTVSNLYFFLTQGGLPAGADFEMSMWVKRLDVPTSAVKVNMGWQAPWEGNAWDTWLPPKTSDWSKMTLHFGATGNNELEFFCDRFVGSMWIDDLEVRQMLPGGGLGENLLTNPGFEFGITPLNNVISPVAKPGKNQVELSWNNSNSQRFQKTNVYIEEDGKLIKRAEIGKDSNRVTIGNLENEKEYEFVLKACDALGNEAYGISVKATPDKFDPRNVLVSPVNGATGLAVSFINPSAATLTDVRLFNITDGQNSEISGLILKNPNDVNRIKLMSLQSGKPYYFKLVFAFSGGNSTEYITYGIPSNLMTDQVPTGWNIGYYYTGSPGEWQYIPAMMSLDHETYHSGNTSLKIVSNQTESLVSNLYSQITQGGIPAGANYEMTMWVKRLNVTTSAVKCSMGWQPPWEGNAWDTWLGSGTSDWAKLTLHFGDTGNNELEFLCELFTETMWIDDLEVRQMLPGGGLGENLLANPGFELGTTPPNNVTSLSATPGNNNVVLSWTNSNSASFKKTNVYIKDNGKLIKRAEIGNDSNSVKIGTLENNKDYEFVLKACDAIGNEADGITVKATPN